MQFGLFYTGLICAFLMATSACSQRSGQPGIFTASTPCSQGTRPLPDIPKEAGCELIKWKLKLFPDTYVLDCDYGMPKQGTRGFIDGGNHLHREGKWISLKNPADTASIIYRLDPDRPLLSVSFLRLNENLLHLLDSRDRLMIGTGAWSYTLNRVQP